MKEWVPYKLKEITTKIGSGSTPTGGKEAYYQSGITLVRSLNIYDFVFELQNLAFINKAQAKKLNGVTIEKDDILLNITGASVGRCTIIPEYLLPARVNQHVSIIRCDKEKVDAKFLLYCINSTSYKDALMSIADSGATSQQRIASILSAYDDLIEVNNQRIKLLEETARELYKEWFVRMRFPGYKKAKFVKGVPDEHKEYVISLDIVKIVSTKLSNDFIYSTLRFNYYGEHIAQFANGTNVLHLNPELLRKESILIPDEDLIKSFVQTVKPMFELVDVLAIEIEQLRQIRDRLLPRLISGKLVVKEIIKTN
jgi:restriction endonuclease S subunit